MSMFARVGLAITVAAGLSLTACNNAPTATGGAVTKIASTTSFGMCAGYCKTTLEVTPGQAVLTREAWGRGAGANLPKQSFTTPLSAQQWADFEAAAGAAKIDALPDTIGCPDCADGGAETLTIEGSGRSKTITFDHGADIKEAQTLLQRVRALRTQLMPKD